MNNNLNNDNIDGNLNPGINSNLSLNANNSILLQYQEGTMESLLSSANNGNQQLAYFKTVNDLSQLNPNKITLDSIANTSQHWDKTTRGLTSASQAVIAVAAVAIAVGTGGLGSGISGAMMTAAATTASTTATISATNASMNTDSNFLNSTNSIADSSWKATSSDESLKNMAISAAVAGAASWAVQASGGSPSLEAGTRADSKVGVNTVKGSDGTIYLEKIGEPGVASKIKVDMSNYNRFGGYGSTYDNNPIFKTINQMPSAPSGAKGHDAFVDANHFGVGMTAASAPPYLIINACAASPSLCAIYVNTRANKDFLQSSNSN